LKKRNRIDGQWAPRLIEMLESPAYRVLSLSGRRVLERVEIELAHHGGQDNGSLPVTYDDFHGYGICRHAIRPAIRECVALGFLEITRPGRAGNAEFRIPNLFRLTYRPSRGERSYGTNEWRKIAELEDAAHIAKTARTNGKKSRPKKQKSSDGLCQISVRKTNHKTPIHSTETITTVHSTENRLLSISRGGGEQ
jgi:hypothetical protein